MAEFMGFIVFLGLCYGAYRAMLYLQARREQKKADSGGKSKPTRMN